MGDTNLKELGELAFDELLDQAAESVMRKLLTGDFKNMRSLVYTAVDISVRWGIEREREMQAATKKGKQK